MIELIKQQLTKNMPDEEKLNRCRELIQLLCLKILDEHRFFNNLAFTGGTALRVVFGVRRFSEDLDFSLVKKEKYSFHRLNDTLLKALALAGLKAESKPKSERTAHSAMLKFSGILKAIGLSTLESHKLSIKLEIDTNPPEGGHVQTRIIQRSYVFSVAHFDLSSMFATKLHACFYRTYLKGRDYYDFIWYMGNKVKPNFTLLNNAIAQTQGKNPDINESNFKEFLLKNIERVNFQEARKDVERFLEDKSELRLFDPKLIKSSIEAIY
ncbi:nucleotidyl transferase AbiEii/AbiGii toxin family protein [bacterium]|nr:MAG: nucleotidyl transferase AbiEii/AbiGii toxin family protein [bacterium]